MIKMLRVVLYSTFLYCVNSFPNEIVKLPKNNVTNNYVSPLPHTYTDQETLPLEFSWNNINNISFLTKSLNQHLPQYCGSCWAHGALSSLADRIKIARKAKDIDINLSIQFILNCGQEIAGSCYGGSATGAYQFIFQKGYVPFDTCLPYIACSSDSKEGFCKNLDIICDIGCKTCSTFTDSGGVCKSIDIFPNASISEYGTVTGKNNMKAEIFHRGPIACGVNAEPILNYRGGILDTPDESREVSHIVSIVGWGFDTINNNEYWIIRNSWGEYWGEMGFFRLTSGENQLGIESECAWSIPKTWTELNKPCNENGHNC